MATPGPINRDKSQENDARYQRSRGGRMDAWQASIDRAEKRRLERLRAQQEAALQAQKDAALASRDKQQQRAEQQNTALRGNIAASNAAMDQRNTLQRDQMQQKSLLARDTLQNQFATQQDKQKTLEQLRRDERQFGYSQLQAQQDFGNQIQRDALQQGYSLERDQLQQGNTLQRDAFQFGLDSKRQDQQQRNTLQRDLMQGGIQAQRDQRLNQFDMLRDDRQQGNLLERDKMQNRFQTERDLRQNQFQTEGDYRQQGFTQQNMYQRETADVAAKWQEQIQQARNAGLDFSPAQQQEMKLLDKAFRQNVLNGNLSEDLKQRAMLEHQKRLATIVPEDKVQHPQQMFEQSIVRDEETGQKFIVTQDPNGRPRYEPLGDFGSGGIDPQAKMEQQAAEKKAQSTQKAMFERQDKFMNLVDMLESEVTETDTGTKRVYPDRKAAIKEAMDRFAPHEKLYRETYGLPPMAEYQAEADAERAKLEQQSRPQQQQATQQPVQSSYSSQPSMADSLAARSGDNMPSQMNPYSGQPVPEKAMTPQSPVSVPAANVRDQATKLLESGDQASSAALQAVHDITAKHNGVPDDTSEDKKILYDALRYLRAKGIKIEPQKKTPKAYESPGDLRRRGL